MNKQYFSEVRTRAYQLAPCKFVAQVMATAQHSGVVGIGAASHAPAWRGLAGRVSRFSAGRLGNVGVRAA